MDEETKQALKEQGAALAERAAEKIKSVEIPENMHSSLFSRLVGGGYAFVIIALIIAIIIGLVILYFTYRFARNLRGYQPIHVQIPIDENMEQFSQTLDQPRFISNDSEHFTTLPHRMHPVGSEMYHVEKPIATPPISMN